MTRTWQYRLLDHVVGADEERLRDRQPERLGGSPRELPYRNEVAPPHTVISSVRMTGWPREPARQSQSDHCHNNHPPADYLRQPSKATVRELCLTVDNAPQR